jgi:putative ATP-binding cassette transporter
VAAPLFAVYDYVQNLLSLEWRAWLTQYLLRRYYHGRAYYRLKMLSDLDNPDQRICDDARSFVDIVVSLLVVVVGKFLNCIAFVGNSLLPRG